MSLEKNVEIRIDSVDNLIDYLTNDLYCSSNNSVNHRGGGCSCSGNGGASGHRGLYHPHQQ